MSTQDHAPRKEDSSALETEDKGNTDKNGSTDTNGGTWLSKILNYLDKGRKSDTAATPTVKVESSDSEASDNENTRQPSQKKKLSQVNMFATDLSAISSLAKKSNFCTLAVSEESWPEYKEFMYRHYRKAAERAAKRESRSD